MLALDAADMGLNASTAYVSWTLSEVNSEYKQVRQIPPSPKWKKSNFQIILTNGIESQEKIKSLDLQIIYIQENKVPVCISQDTDRQTHQDFKEWEYQEDCWLTMCNMFKEKIKHKFKEICRGLDTKKNDKTFWKMCVLQ